MDARGYRIGKTAEASGVTVKAIHYYEQIGLIPKARRRNSGAHTGGNRIYSESDVGRLRFIRHARLLGLNLAEIRDLLAVADGKGCPSTQPEYQEILRRHLHEIDERVCHLLGLRGAIEALLMSDRRADGETCSWNTCECMGPAHSMPSSSKDSSVKKCC